MEILQNYLESKGHSKKSIKICVYEINMFITWCEKEDYDIDNMMYKDVLNYISYLQNEKCLKQVSIAKYVLSLKHYFKCLIKEGIRTTNPVLNIHIKGVRRRAHHRILDDQEMELIYMEFRVKEKEGHRDFEYMQSLQHKVMLGLYLFQGMDSENLKQMTIQDINLKTSQVTIPSTRRSNERTLELRGIQLLDLMYFTTQCRLDMLEYTQRFECYNDLFINLRETRELKITISNLLKSLQKQFPNIQTLQQLRASRITYWLQTENLREAQYRAGHKYISSTEKYKVHDVESLALAIEKFHPLV